MYYAKFKNVTTANLAHYLAERVYVWVVKERAPTPAGSTQAYGTEVVVFLLLHQHVI